MTQTRTYMPDFRRQVSDYGSYWVSATPAARLREHLKTAELGGEQETGFEQAFGSLAYAYIKDKAPKLVDYLIGFQLIDRNNDNTKAVGVFGAKVGNQWLYMPVFFLNGDLKGHELLFSKNQNLFVPLKENWVNYILSRKPHMLGEGSSRDAYQLGAMMPNIERLSFPPMSGKYGCDQWAKDFVNGVVATVANKLACAMYPGQTSDSAKLNMTKLAAAPFTAALGLFDFDLKALLGSDWRLTKAAWDACQSYPALKAGFDRFYGPDLFPGLLAKLGSAQPDVSVLPQEARKSRAVKQASGRDSLIPGLREKAAAAPAGKIRIYTDADYTVTRNLDDADKGKLLSNGYLVKDERKGDEFSVAYNTQVKQVLVNPGETGIYEVLESPGEFSRMLVICNPGSAVTRHDFCTVVRLDDGDKSWVNIAKPNVFTRRTESKEEYQGWFDQLGERKDLAVGGVYVGVSANGEGTLPFTVRRKHDGDGYETCTVDFHDYRVVPRARTAARLARQSPEDPYLRDASNYNARIVKSGKPGTRLRSLGDALHIPENFRFLQLRKPPKSDDEKDSLLTCCSPVDVGSEPKPISCGDIADAQMLFVEKTARLKLHADQHEVIITSPRGTQRYGYKQALFALVRQHGLSEKQASDLLRDTQVKSSVICRIKYADGFPNLGPGPGAPAIPPPSYGTEQMGYNSVNSIYPQEEEIPVPGLEAGRTDPRIYDPFLNITPDSRAMQSAQQAASVGQKELFDTSMLSGLLKAVRQDSLVDRYLGDLVSAVDKLGRILFMFYWHQLDFADRYGKNDLPELEDALRNSFESLGDTVLHLREKTIEPSPGDEGDSDIEEVARN